MKLTEFKVVLNKIKKRIVEAIGADDSEEKIQKLIFDELSKDKVVNPSPGDLEKCKRDNKYQYIELKTHCIPEKHYSNCRESISARGWYREVNCQLKICCKGDICSQRVDLAKVIYEDKTSLKFECLLEVKVFKKIKSKDGHEYPILTTSGCCDWYCFPKIKGRDGNHTQKATDSDEGQLIYDFLKMIVMAGNSKEVELFQIIIVDGNSLDLKEELEENIRNIYSTYKKLYSEDDLYEILDYKSLEPRFFSFLNESNKEIYWKKSVECNRLIDPKIKLIDLDKDVKVLIIRHSSEDREK